MQPLASRRLPAHAPRFWTAALLSLLPMLFAVCGGGGVGFGVTLASVRWETPVPVTVVSGTVEPGGERGHLVVATAAGARRFVVVPADVVEALPPGTRTEMFGDREVRESLDESGEVGLAVGVVGLLMLVVGLAVAAVPWVLVRRARVLLQTGELVPAKVVVVDGDDAAGRALVGWITVKYAVVGGPPLSHQTFRTAGYRRFGACAAGDDVLVAKIGNRTALYAKAPVA